MKKPILHIDNAEISLLPLGQEDYISLTDMAHSQMQEHIIFRWMSLKSTIEYIGEWEALYNPDFNYTEFGTIRNAAGINELICLSNMENLNAVFINDGIPQSERLVRLNQIAIQQMRVLEEITNRNLLK